MAAATVSLDVVVWAIGGTEVAMMTSSNPAFNFAGKDRGYAGFSEPQQANPAYPNQGYALPSVTAYRPLTIDDVVTKTGITLGVALIAGVLSVYFKLFGLAGPAAIIGLVLALIVIFTQSTNPALIVAYSAAEGISLGALTGVLDNAFPGMAIQAIIGTFGVFIGMLVVYKTGAVRVTPRLTKWIIGATVGVLILTLANLLFALFGVNLGLRNGGGALSIVFSLVVIGIAALNFLLDFDQATQAIQEGRPAKYAWYIAFGLTVTLVWLYTEIIRLLVNLQRN